MANAFGYYDGLTIKNGRLINEQIEPGMTGIQKASLYRKQMKKQYKIYQGLFAYLEAWERILILHLNHLL